MSCTSNEIERSGGTVNFNLPTSQPSEAGLWINGGVLTYFDGTTNRIFDFDEGDVLDTFGVDIGVDI